MRKQPSYSRPALRFKRWSRKAYAAFVSVQRAVTIGQLSANIAERFFVKQESVQSLALRSDRATEEEEEAASEGQSGLQALALRLLLAALPAQTALQPAAPAIHYIHTTSRKSGSPQYITEGFRSFCFDPLCPFIGGIMPTNCTFTHYLLVVRQLSAYRTTIVGLLFDSCRFISRQLSDY